MPQKKNKKQQNMKKKQAPSKGTPVRDIVLSTLKTLMPIAAKGALSLATGIPFPASGMQAIAAPTAGMGLSVSAPVANGNVIGVSKASIANSGSGIRVRHKEYITDVIHTTANTFELLLFEMVNPTNPRLFPWLCSIAPRFETFKFNALKFVYEPQCSTGSQGTVMLAVDYDASDSPPVDKTQLMSYRGAVRSPAWFACCNTSALSDLRKSPNYYTLSSSSSSDPRLGNVGRFILAMQSEATAFTAGELYVEYDISLDTPQLQDDASSHLFYWSPEVFPTSFDLGTPAIDAGSLPVTFESSGGIGYLQFNKAGRYQVSTIAYPVTSVTPSANVTETFRIVPSSGSLATVQSYAGISNLTSGTTYIPDQAAPCSDCYVSVPNPGELVEIQQTSSATSATTATWGFRITITEIDDLVAQKLNITPSPQISSIQATLRLMNKRKEDVLFQTSTNPFSRSSSSTSSAKPPSETKSYKTWFSERGEC